MDEVFFARYAWSHCSPLHCGSCGQPATSLRVCGRVAAAQRSLPNAGAAPAAADYRHSRNAAPVSELPLFAVASGLPSKTDASAIRRTGRQGRVWVPTPQPLVDKFRDANLTPRHSFRSWICDGRPVTRRQARRELERGIHPYWSALKRLAQQEEWGGREVHRWRHFQNEFLARYVVTLSCSLMNLKLRQRSST